MIRNLWYKPRTGTHRTVAQGEFGPASGPPESRARTLLCARLTGWLATSILVGATTLTACGGVATATPAQTPAVSGSHPRLLLTPAMVADLRARANDADVAAVKAAADRLVANGLDAGYQGEGWAGDGPVLGLAYLLTGDARYARPLLDLLDSLNAAAARGDLSALTVDSTFASRSTAFALAIAYDWIYPELGDSRRAATVRTVNAYYEWFLNGNNVFERDGPAHSNYFGGHVLGFGAMGYATVGDNPRAPEIIAKVRSLFDSNVPASFATGPSNGGFPVEGYVYGTNNFVRLFEYIRMVQTATGEVIGNTGAWANQILTTMLHALKPNLWQLVDEGDYTGDTVGFLNENQLQVFAALADDATTKGHARWLLANHGTPAQGQLPSRSVLLRVLFPATNAPIDYRGALPTHHHANGAALLLMRSGWEPTAVWASFNANIKRWTGHVGRQAAHFTIQRGSDNLLVNGHQWKQQKVFQSSALVGYQGPGYIGNTWVNPTSAWTNTLFADDGPGGYLFDGATYAGGQGGFSENQPYLFSQRRDSTYVKSDVTRAYAINRPEDYDQRAVRLFVRNFAFFAPATFVVFDRVRVIRSSVSFRLSFHFNSNGPPALQGGTMASSVGGSRLFMRALLPENLQMTATWQQLDGVNFVPRVDLQPAAATTDFDALTVFTAVGSDVTSMPETRVVRSENGSMVGPQVLDPQLERVALFASAETDRVPESVAYSVGSARARHYLFDLLPNTVYSVAASQATSVRVVVTPAATGISTNAAGVLAFDLAGTTVTPLPPDA